MTGLELIAGAFSIAQGVTGAISAIMGAQARSAQAQYNAEIAKRNEQLALQSTASQIEDKQREQRRQIGSIRAAYGASGLELAGSPLDVLEDTATEQQYDLAKVEHTGRMKALGYKDQQNQFEAQASNELAAAPIAALGSIFSAGSSLMKNPALTRV
jgi:hypothetical protein